jgi:hypothetical protein
MVGVVRTSLGALLVAPVGAPPAVKAPDLTASLAAVAVTAVARPADRKRRVAPHAAQQVQESADDQRLAQDLHHEWTSRRVGEMLPAPKTLPA